MSETGGIFYNDFEEIGGTFAQDEAIMDVGSEVNFQSDVEPDVNEDDEVDDDDDDIYSDLSTQELVQRSMAAMKAIVDQKMQ